MSKRIPMTIKGRELLKKKLQKLKSVQRPKIISEISEARKHGDLKENAEYHSAREKQSFIEGRIKEIEIKLNNSQIINIKNIKNKGIVIFGATITLINKKTRKITIYKIVGEDEFDIKKNKISISSPLARSLIKKEKGEEITVITPKGELNFNIINIQHI